MFKENIPINLIFSGSHTFNTDLQKALARLGYQDVKTVGLHDVEDAVCKRAKKIFILPVIHRSLDQKKIRIACSQLQEKPVLGIIRTDDLNLNDIFVRACNDFMYWPFSDNEFAYRMNRISELFMYNENLDREDGARNDYLSMNMIGKSPEFLQVLRNITKIARCDAPVLIKGETGTGKELTARAIHYLSERRNYPFIPVNCGAIPDSLLENELFGHQQGAFTDARSSQEGLVSQAEEGTLFLDEVETFSQKGQVVLLRFLQDFQYKNLGSNTYQKANVRIIAASNAKLQDLVKLGKFRQDLYYRLNIMPVLMPSLAQRGNDILELADYFLNRFRIQYNQPEKRLDKDSIRWMTHYNWPGNVRELENMIHREFLLEEGTCIKLGEEHNSQKDPGESFIDRRQDHLFTGNFSEVKTQVISQFEKTYLTQLLRETEGNVTLAAKKAGKERRALGKLLKKHGISKYS